MHRMQKQRHARNHAAAGAEEGGIGKNERRREAMLVEQLLPGVNICQDPAEQARALDQTRLEARPFSGRNQQWQRVQLPGPLKSLGVPVDIIGDTVLAEETPGCVAARLHFRRAELVERLDERLPVDAGQVRRGEHLVIHPARGGVAGGDRPARGVRRTGDRF